MSGKPIKSKIGLRRNLRISSTRKISIEFKLSIRATIRESDGLCFYLYNSHFCSKNTIREQLQLYNLMKYKWHVAKNNELGIAARDRNFYSHFLRSHNISPRDLFFKFTLHYIN